MNDEKRIRDLMRRLAAMSPEPPEFPEETLMARHNTSKSRVNPVLIFAAGAALVAAVMIPVFLLSRGEAPVGVGTTTTTLAPITTIAPDTSTSTPQATTTTTAPETSTTTTPVAAPWVGTVFLYQIPENSFLGNPALVPVSLALNGGPLPGAPFTEALAAIGDELPELSSPLMNATPAGVQIVDLTESTADGVDVWVADMNEAFIEGAGGLLADITMLNQLIYTITYENNEASVVFTVGGNAVDAFGSEGIDLTAPVDRETFIDHLAPLILTEPIDQNVNANLPVGTTTDPGYRVMGMANVYEAALSVLVFDANGELYYQTPVTASCGTGCWGEFRTIVLLEHMPEGDALVQVLTYSAEDGSPQNVINVPVPAGGVWEITVG